MNTANRIGLLVMFVAAVTWTATTRADGHRYQATDPVWKAECGSCHIAYPPALLPAASWRAVMSGLDLERAIDDADARSRAAEAALEEKKKEEPEPGP